MLADAEASTKQQDALLMATADMNRFAAEAQLHQATILQLRQELDLVTSQFDLSRERIAGAERKANDAQAHIQRLTSRVCIVLYLQFVPPSYARGVLQHAVELNSARSEVRFNEKLSVCYIHNNLLPRTVSFMDVLDF